MSQTTLDVVDLTSFDQKPFEVQPCARCAGTPREAEYIVRFLHTTRDQQHLLAYCAIHLFMVVSAVNEQLVCPCSGKLEEVVYVRHWPIRGQEAA